MADQPRRNNPVPLHEFGKQLCDLLGITSPVRRLVIDVNADAEDAAVMVYVQQYLQDDQAEQVINDLADGSACVKYVKRADVTDKGDVRFMQAELAKLTLSPGDVLVLHCDDYLSAQTHDEWRRLLAAQFPGHESVVIDGGLRLGVGEAWGAVGRWSDRHRHPSLEVRTDVCAE